jgi:hypothetical protein
MLLTPLLPMAVASLADLTCNPPHRVCPQQPATGRAVSRSCRGACVFTSVGQTCSGMTGKRFPWPGLWFRFGTERSSWIAGRNAWLTVVGTFTTAQYLELDHHVVPAIQPGSRCGMLTGDEPHSRPGEPAQRGAVGVGRDDNQASIMALSPGVSNGHPGQNGYSHLASVTWTAARHVILRTTLSPGRTCRSTSSIAVQRARQGARVRLGRRPWLSSTGWGRARFAASAPGGEQCLKPVDRPGKGVPSR